MTSDSVSDAALQALQRHFDAMPPAAALQLRIDRFEGHALHLQAPLAVHVNDKGCAFGGSLASLMTLACWGVVTLRLWQQGLDADVFVADTQVHYRAPLFADLHAQARLVQEEAWPGVVARLHERGRASVQLAGRVLLSDGGIAAQMQARYVAVGKG